MLRQKEAALFKMGQQISPIKEEKQKERQEDRDRNIEVRLGTLQGIGK